MDHITLNTSGTLTPREPIHLTLCGEDMTIHRPKTMALLAARQATDNTVDADYPDDPDAAERARADAMLSFLTATFRRAGMLRFLHRAADRNDPIDVDEMFEAVRQCVELWDDYPDHGTPSVVVTPSTDPEPPRPILRLVVDTHDIDIEAYPPKRLLLMIVAGIVSKPELAAERLAIERLFSGILNPDDAEWLQRRIDMPDDMDTLDIEHLDQPINDLIGTWFNDEHVPANRAERRHGTLPRHAARP